ncbi:DUF6543 domain-containing protein [Pseudomonas sp. MWU12-3103b]|uniref:dermonecrotic toxin domain-containing protein n=1 Tax=Pseudomonas sp. MWU12-3103b TaxID=2928857 RepID=UPI001FFF8E33|nr:DUF6543 domain-containing protein [Pseudomonas sp. MWU12-3103b]
MMPAPIPPLLFQPILNSPGSWRELGNLHHLSTADFQWLSHVQLATHALRSQQTPPMLAQRILLNTAGAPAVPLAGSFILSATPDDHGILLYTPFAGLKKHASLTALTAHLEQQLNSASEDDRLLAFLAFSQRKRLAEQHGISVTYQLVEGDIFEDQRAVIEHCHQLNTQAMLDELMQLPELGSLLQTIVDALLTPTMRGVDQTRTRVNLYATTTATGPASTDLASRHGLEALSLGDALLLHYRHTGWPVGQTHEFSHPDRTFQASDQQHWETAVTTASGKLLVLLYQQMERYWNGPSADGASRRDVLAQIIRQQALADFLLKREAGIIDQRQFDSLLTSLGFSESLAPRAAVETVRLWEHQANFVELAGALMIGHSESCLYTPTHGLQVLKDYADLKSMLLGKFASPGHEDELYGLLSLDERQRFLGFDRPQVSGKSIAGDVFSVLLELIITKQRQNIDYALQLYRHSDGVVDIRALFDKALDIRSMLHERLVTLDARGRWSTRPMLTGNPLPSRVLADTAAAEVRKFASIMPTIAADFAAQPLTVTALQRTYLQGIAAKLAHALSVGINGEARLRVLDGTLSRHAQTLVDTVFNPDHPDRSRRKALNGIRPDAWSLTLQVAGESEVLPLANCVLLTERGGLDTQHSGRAILWTPALGLEVFRSIEHARQVLNQRLLDPQKRLALLENLSPLHQRFHQHYTLGRLQLISGNVLQDRTESTIEHFLQRCEQVRGRHWPKPREHQILKTLSEQVVETNLQRATALAMALGKQHSLPAWLGMARLDDQQLHLELLEQWRHSVIDDEDYLHALPTLRDYIRQTLKTLLNTRLHRQDLDPEQITVTPALSLIGSAMSLTDFALNHAHIAQDTAFTLSSSTDRTLPTGLDQQAVRSLLLSLNVATTFANKITSVLSANDVDAEQRKLRFIQQLPWQLLQHAHQLQLQQRLSPKAFDLISQVLDMPDAVARATVHGADAIVRPLALIKTAGASAIKALGLYLIGPAEKSGPQVLYAPYHGEHAFSEFEDEAAVIAALNTPGSLQDLLLRRLPENQRSIFSALFKASSGQTSEMNLATTPVDGNLLLQLFDDNLALLPHLLSSHSLPSAQADWDAAKHLFSSGIQQIRGLLPGKLAYVQFLWQSYQDFLDSAEALQDHHWKRALQTFVAGAAEMISLGRLALESRLESQAVAAPQTPQPTTLSAPVLAQTKPTDPLRTSLQTFEAPTIALKDLTHDAAEGTYQDLTTKATYAPIAGKVYPVERPGAVWQIKGAEQPGPVLQHTASRQLVLDPDRHTVHFGKAMSTMLNHYATHRQARYMLNIEAQGMEEIRARHPEKARMLIEAIDLARHYAFNSLHNLAQLRNYVPGTRLDTFLKSFFDVQRIDADILDKLKQAIVPICDALVDPTEDLLNTSRFVVGSNRHSSSGVIAFVLGGDLLKKVHFTEKFFNQGLDWYNTGLTEPFNVDGHARAATLIHEFSHQFSKTVDIASLEARRPFADLIATVTGYGAARKQVQTRFQREALSLSTRREELFSRWSDNLQEWLDIDEFEGMEHVRREVLKTTGTRNLEDARTAFLSPTNPHPRIDTILRNADSIAFLICEMGRQLDPVTQPHGGLN